MDFPSKFLSWDAATHEHVLVRTVYIDMAGGDLAAGVMLSQLIYWSKPGKNGSKLRVKHGNDLWIVKSWRDWYDECRLSRSVSNRALERLRDLGIVRTARPKFRGVPTTHIAIAWAGFQKEWDRVLEERANREHVVEVPGEI